MDLHKDLMKTYGELTEFRKQALDIEETEKTPVKRLLQEVNDLVGSVAQEVIEVDKAGEKICNDTLSVKCQLQSKNSLCVGQESVQPLITLKNISTEVFADIKECSSNDFNEEIHLEQAYKNLEQVQERQLMSEEFVRYMKLTSESVQKIIENLKNTKSEKTDHQQEASQASSTVCSTSEFSLFENLNTKVATSSPLQK